MRRLGLFVIDHGFIDSNFNELRNLLKDVVIVRAESNYGHGYIEYMGISHLFDEVPEGCMANKYNVIFNKNKNGVVTFEFRKE
jgi:hypothetical protein